MQLTVKTGDASAIKADLLALALFERASEKRGLPRHAAALDRALGGAISAVLRSGDFRGRSGEEQLVYPGKGGPKRVLLIGLGSEKELDEEAFRRVGGSCVRAATQRSARALAIALPRMRAALAAPSAAGVATGCVLADYRFDSYRTSPSESRPALRSVRLVYESLADERAARAAATDAVVVAQAQNFARKLSNEPANELTPAALASETRKMARKAGLTCRVLTKADLVKGGFGGILAVGQGSANPPRLIVLEHSGRNRRGRTPPTLALVGKGITFDSGGISIKPSAGMQDMKHDMSGAATVIGAMQAVAGLDLPHRIVGIVAAAENMPSAEAYRPGDIIGTLAGKTIEVLNTDAEGRIVLADALHYATREYDPAAMLDYATLTGAMMVALGPWATGIFSNNEKLLDAIRRAGQASGEEAWPMPLFEAHRKAMKSPIADLRNTGGRNGGASTAAGFLWEFVGDTPWAHLDIAGTAWSDTASPYLAAGATGVGVRLTVEFLRAWDPHRDI